MAQIKVTAEVLNQKAAEVRGLKSQHDDVIAKMSNLVYGLNETWQGEAQSAFVAKFDSMKSTFTNFSELIEGYAKLMDVAAREYAAAESSIKSTIQNS